MAELTCVFELPIWRIDFFLELVIKGNLVFLFLVTPRVSVRPIFGKKKKTLLQTEHRRETSYAVPHTVLLSTF